MEFLPAWMNQFGYLVLFSSLLLELLALPFPGEVLMSYAGFLVYQGELSWIASIIMAGLGSIMGMTLSYWIGLKLGVPFFHKYGYRIHFGPDKLEKISGWFERYGYKMLIISYFIPGIRHFTGYFSGITRIPYRTYALYAYTGAFLWVSTFISLGKILGPKWEEFHDSVKKYLIIGGIIAAFIILAIYLYRVYKPRLLGAKGSLLDNLIGTFHSLGRVKFLVAGAAAVFFGLFVLMLGLIQDYLSNEFQQFDTITMYIIHAIFEDTWFPWMKQITLFASWKMFILVMVLTFVWIWIKGKNRGLEAAFLFVIMMGGEILDEGLRLLFHRIGPDGSALSVNLPYTFPSEQSLMVLTVYGFVAFLFIRHSRSYWLRIFAPLAVLTLSLLVGLSRIFLEVQYPSDVVAGYVFGGVWLSLNIVLLEIFRLLRKV